MIGATLGWIAISMNPMDDQASSKPALYDFEVVTARLLKIACNVSHPYYFIMYTVAYISADNQVTERRTLFFRSKTTSLDH